MKKDIDFSQFDSFFEDMNGSPEKGEEPQKEIQKSKPVTTKEAIQQTTGVDPNLLKNGQAKIAKIRQEMNALFSERSEAIDVMLLAIATGSNMLMLGNPGTAKSFLTYEMCSRIDGANYFQWMLNKTSDPSEILGTFSIKEMESDKFMRITSGKLPEAHIAFLDEVYKSNSPTLNALLTIMNEHIFYNDGKAVPVPLISLIGASNEGPDDDSLMALHDRFLFRINVKYVKEGGNRKRMYNNFIARRNGTLSLNTKTTITLDELTAIQKTSEVVRVPKNLVNEFLRLINDLDKQGIHVSDRRQNECFKVMQGSAVLRGSDTVGYEDLRSLIYVLWEHEDELDRVEKSILKRVDPFSDQFRDLMKNFEEIKNDIESISDPKDKLHRGVEVKGTLEKIMGRTNKLIGEANKSGKDTSEYIKFRNEIMEFSQKTITASATSFVEGFDSDDNPFVD